MRRGVASARALLTQHKKLCKVFQDIIKSKCTFTPTESDKFNLYGDDKLVQKRFNNMKDSNEKSTNAIKQVFDGISTEDALSFISSRL